MADAGLIVLTSFISPFRAEREMVARDAPEGEFIEVFVDTPLAEAEKRDRQGPLRQGARRRDQELHRHIDSPYEPPEARRCASTSPDERRGSSGGPDRRGIAKASLMAARTDFSFDEFVEFHFRREVPLHGSP